MDGRKERKNVSFLSEQVAVGLEPEAHKVPRSSHHGAIEPTAIFHTSPGELPYLFSLSASLGNFWGRPRTGMAMGLGKHSPPPPPPSPLKNRVF